MKIIFPKVSVCANEFEISNIQFECDENNAPIDIVIRADEDTLVAISELSCYGCNIQPLNEIDALKNNASHEALYARLCEFNVVNYRKCIFK